MAIAETRGHLYTTEEKRNLIKQLAKARDSISLSSLYANTKLKGRIPSRRTLYRLLNNQKQVRIHDDTARQIENLLLIIKNTEAEAASDSVLFGEIYASLRGILRITKQQNIDFIKRFSGSYKCIRLTTRSREILVTHMRIYAGIGSVPRFSHTEVVPDEAESIGSRNARVMSHEGFILPESRKATFLAFDGQVRQISCQISTNVNQPAFSGLLLTREALDDHPFAARIFIERTTERSHDEIVNLQDEYGLFSIRNSKYKAFLPYIRNKAETNGALYPIVTI